MVRVRGGLFNYRYNYLFRTMKQGRCNSPMIIEAGIRVDVEMGVSLFVRVEQQSGDMRM